MGVVLGGRRVERMTIALVEGGLDCGGALLLGLANVQQLFKLDYGVVAERGQGGGAVTGRGGLLDTVRHLAWSENWSVFCDWGVWLVWGMYVGVEPVGCGHAPRVFLRVVCSARDGWID